jgi:predicted cobalt transporter CbtA
MAASGHKMAPSGHKMAASSQENESYDPYDDFQPLERKRVCW